jgi:AraC family transcriptional regulator, regulatory protein of adaptative response / DNA-3-methyladenine glycosylase II
VIDLDPDRCYRAAASRDARFDGCFYTAVRTTGIYCRPSCPATTPKRRNVEFFASAAAAQQHGYRACKRCRPDASPGSPEWDVRTDVVARAMRLIADGVVDREGVGGLAGRLGYSTRHLTRLLDAELGAGPIALARAQRAQTARLLLETTDMAITDVAFAAGFGSVRQFNDTVREVYASSPSELRRGGAHRRAGRAGSAPVTVRLAARAPFDSASVLAFLAARTIECTESVELVQHTDAAGYRRSMSLPGGPGVVEVRPLTCGATGVQASFRLTDWADLAPAVRRVRRLFDLDADPVAVDAVLAADPSLAALVATTPGRRVPGSVDPFETAIRAVVGQQVSVAGARTVLGRIVAAVGERLAAPQGAVTTVFPSPAALAEVDDDVLAMPTARRRTIRTLAAAIATGEVVLDAGVDRDEVVDRLVSLPGIGPWTAGYIAMRGLGDPDVFLDTDLGVRRGLAALGLTAADADRWRPWRSYALHHLWEMT